MKLQLSLIILMSTLFSHHVNAKPVSSWQLFTFKVGIRAGCMEAEYSDSQSLLQAWQHCQCVMDTFHEQLSAGEWHIVSREIMQNGKALEELSILRPVLEKLPLCSKDSSNEEPTSSDSE